MNLTLNDFFYNIEKRGLPPEDTEEFDDLVKWEEQKCKGGVYVDGVFFSGWLYWHLNHWWIRDDYEDEYQNIQRDIYRPSLRDNEWIVAQYLEECRLQKLGYMHVGVRQFGKSEIMASYIAYNAILFQHTQNVIVGGNDDDLQLLRDKIDFGIKSLWKGLKIPKLDKDTKKNMTRLGFKSSEGAGEDQVWSYIIVRNVAEGNKTEGPAGVTAKSFAIDEIGKFSFAQAFEAAKPAFMSKFGWRCVPLLFGTGGSFTKGADAERIFWHPRANKFLGVVDPKTGKETAIFMSGVYRIDCKYETTLADFLIEQGKVDRIADLSNLKMIPIWVSDKEKAEALIRQERADKAKDPDRTVYLKQIMYYPLSPEECFLTSAYNFYNAGLAKKQIKVLEDNDIKATSVKLSFDIDGKTIIHEEVKDRVPISSFPTKEEENLNAPISIWEFPIKNPPYGLYVAGVDPYRFAQSANSNSLGAVYIFKRIHDIQSETYQDCFVASYVARPDTKEEWNLQARLLIKYYNAQTLCENDEMSFIDYMNAMGDGHLLEDQPKWLGNYIQGFTTTMTRDKGISRSIDKIRNFLKGCLKGYMEEKVSVKKNEDGEVISTMLGISQIYDPVFLMEIANWNEDGNFDREIAGSLAIALARHFDKVGVTVTDVEKDDKVNFLFDNRRKRHTGSLLTSTRHKNNKPRKAGRLFH